MGKQPLRWKQTRIACYLWHLPPVPTISNFLRPQLSCLERLRRLYLSTLLASHLHEDTLAAGHLERKQSAYETKSQTLPRVTWLTSGRAKKPQKNRGKGSVSVWLPCLADANRLQEHNGQSGRRICVWWAWTPGSINTHSNLSRAKCDGSLPLFVTVELVLPPVFVSLLGGSRGNSTFSTQSSPNASKHFIPTPIPLDLVGIYCWLAFQCWFRIYCL